MGAKVMPKVIIDTTGDPDSSDDDEKYVVSVIAHLLAYGYGAIQDHGAEVANRVVKVKLGFDAYEQLWNTTAEMRDDIQEFLKKYKGAFRPNYGKELDD
jgi:hypothetical protein